MQPWTWSGSAAGQCSLPLHRAVGVWSPANARVRVRPPFDLSGATAASKLWLNADAHWGPKLPQGGCDETCAAYVLVELEDSETGKVIEGYDRSRFNPIMDEDGINLPLRWNNSTKLRGGNVQSSLVRAAKCTVFTWATSSIRATRVTATSFSSLGNGASHSVFVHFPRMEPAGIHSSILVSLQYL